GSERKTHLAVPPGEWRQHAYKRKTDATREAPSVVERTDQLVPGNGQTGRDGVTERLVVPGMPGNAGGGKGPQFRTNAESGKGQEIGQPINSGKRSETADGVTCKSEGRTRFPLLRPIRQDLPARRAGTRLRLLPRQQGRSRSRRPHVRGGRGVWTRTLDRGTRA